MESTASTGPEGPEGTDSTVDAEDIRDTDNAGRYDDDDDELVSYVAVCPISDAVADMMIAAARVDLRNGEEADKALVTLGFLKDQIEIDGAWYRTPEGHLVYGDFTMAVPFVYSYAVGGELHAEDYWGTMPGWTSVADPKPGTFAAHLEATVQTFTRRLGTPPERDGRTREPFGTRIAVWRVEGNLLIVGEGKEPYSYWQDDQGVAMIVTAPDGLGAKLPGADVLEAFMRY